MTVTDRLRRDSAHGLGPGRVGAEADRIDAAVRDGFLELPVGADGAPVRPGDVVYGTDGSGWKVVGIGGGSYPVVVVPRFAADDMGQFRRMRAEWCRHRETLAQVAERIRSIAERGADITVADIKSLGTIADDLAERGERE